MMIKKRIRELEVKEDVQSWKAKYISLLNDKLSGKWTDDAHARIAELESCLIFSTNCLDWGCSPSGKEIAINNARKVLGEEKAYNDDISNDVVAEIRAKRGVDVTKKEWKYYEK